MYCMQRNAIVVWNPWQEKAKVMSDFGDEEVSMFMSI